VKSRLSPLGGATIRQSDARWVAPRRRLGFKILALPIVQTGQQHPRAPKREYRNYLANEKE
jgi:hypothetical protein